MNTTICPNPDVLADYVLGRVSEADLTGIASHVEACPACQSQLETLDGLSDTVVTCLRRAAALDQADPDDSLLEEVLSRIGSITSGSGPDSHDHAHTAILPRQIGQYQLVEELGHGGMGDVYKAFHTKLKRTVAVKLLPAHRQRSPQAVSRFLGKWKPWAGSITRTSSVPTMRVRLTASSFLRWSSSRESPWRRWCAVLGHWALPMPARLFGKLLLDCSTSTSMALFIGMSSRRTSC